MAIDEGRAFRPVRIAVLTVSDSRGLAEDRSGDTLVARIEDAGHIVPALPRCQRLARRDGGVRHHREALP